MNKKGSGAGEIVEMIPILVMVSVIAVVVFGASSVYYNYDISVRDAEARLLGRAVGNCLAPEGILNLDEAIEGDILEYCGLESNERFYVGVDVFGEEEGLLGNEKMASFSSGDSGMLWVRDLFGKAVLKGNAVGGWDNENVEKMVNYNPGYFGYDFSVHVIRDGERSSGKIEMEVLVNYEK
jgi:hypothetical protein